jgi:hypothetical protein
LAVLREQINKRYPNRSKVSDGTVGDLKHRQRKSDHTPFQGVVHAFDVTHDPRNGFDAHRFAEHLRQQRDDRISYVISNHRIFSSSVAPWTWRKYTGKNGHTVHTHVSVKHGRFAQDRKPWSIVPAPQLGIASLEEAMPEPVGEGSPEDRCYWDEVIVDPTDADRGQDPGEA